MSAKSENLSLAAINGRKFSLALKVYIFPPKTLNKMFNSVSLNPMLFSSQLDGKGSYSTSGDE